MAQKSRTQKLLLLSLCGLVTLGAVGFVVGKALSEQIKKDRQTIIPILVGGSDPEKNAGQSGWYYVNRTNWDTYKKTATGAWIKVGFLYDMVEYHAIGTTILNAEGLYNLYNNVLNQHYKYEASIEQWVEDFKADKLFSYQEYVVTFKNYDDSVISTQSARLRETITFDGDLPFKPEDPENVYTFKKWSNALNSISESFDTTAEYHAIPFGKIFKDNSDGTSVKVVLDAAEKDNIVNLTIPENINGKPVTTIGEEAFRECTNLETVVLPESLTTIGGWSFYGCSKLKGIHIPAGVTSIADTAFGWGCDSLEYFSVDEENAYFATDDDALYVKDYSEIIRYPVAKQTSYENGKYYVKDTVKKIWTFAYCGFKGINEIILAQATTDIGGWAFGGSSIESFNFTKNAKTISTDPFGGCPNIKEFTVSEGNYGFKAKNGILYNFTETTLLRHPANNNENLFEIADTVKYIGAYAFNSCSLKEIVIPSSVNTISYGAFSECHELMILKIPSSITTIDELAFIECKSLIDMYIPNTVITIGKKAFDFMGDVVIRCQAKSKPEGWDSMWCTSQKVLWSQSEK